MSASSSCAANSDFFSAERLPNASLSESCVAKHASNLARRARESTSTQAAPSAVSTDVISSSCSDSFRQKRSVAAPTVCWTRPCPPSDCTTFEE
eukprot:1191457-Pleurochrysis_carterae.AAC.2